MVLGGPVFFEVTSRRGPFTASGAKASVWVCLSPWMVLGSLQNNTPMGTQKNDTPNSDYVELFISPAALSLFFYWT